MSKQKKPKGKKKSGNQDRNTKNVLLITALINLLIALIELIEKLTE